MAPMAFWDNGVERLIGGAAFGNDIVVSGSDELIVCTSQRQIRAVNRLAITDNRLLGSFTSSMGGTPTGIVFDGVAYFIAVGNNIIKTQDFTSFDVPRPALLPLGVIGSIVFDGSVVYTHDQRSNNLYTVARTGPLALTALGAVSGVTRNSTVEGMTMHGTDLLMINNQRHLYTLDTSTRVATQGFRVPTESNAFPTAMASVNGELLVSTASELLWVDLDRSKSFRIALFQQPLRTVRGMGTHPRPQTP